jgi:hypothetical protein
MRHAPSTLHFSYAFRQPVPAGAIEWEELPSLAATLAERLDSRRLGDAGTATSMRATVASNTVWDSTRPAALEVPVTSGPFREPLEGVAIREVDDPDVFRHFFGR